MKCVVCLYVTIPTVPELTSQPTNCRGHWIIKGQRNRSILCPWLNALELGQENSHCNRGTLLQKKCAGRGDGRHSCPTSIFFSMSLQMHMLYISWQRVPRPITKSEVTTYDLLNTFWKKRSHSDATVLGTKQCIRICRIFLMYLVIKFCVHALRRDY